MRIINEESEQIHHGENKAGITLHNFLVHFDEIFNKSSYIYFKNFFDRNSDVSNWIIFSDYVLGDKNKPNDVITFSIMPYTSKFVELGEDIDKLSFKDIKKLKRVNKDFIEFINKSEILNLSILVDKNVRLDPFNERLMLQTSYRTAINQVKMWMQNEGEKAYCNDLLSAYNVLLSEVSKQSTNLKNIRNIEIVSSLTAYIAHQICIASNVELIGWFSDRDAILSHKNAKFKKPVIFDLINNLFNVLRYKENENHTEKLTFGLPETKGKLWYDSFNRIPDLIAATLADYNLEKNVFSHEKFIPVLDDVIANKEKSIVYKIFSGDNGCFTALLPFEITDETG